MLAGFKVDVSHQEQERILSEVEAWYLCAKEQAGVEWLPLEGIKNFLFMDLGYEDEAEFEDAIHGSFEEFLAAFPHMEVKDMEGKPQLRISLPDTPPRPRKLTLTVNSSQQLLDTTLLKDGNADLELPHLEFEIRPIAKRQIDTLYNHLVQAVDEIEMHAQALVEDQYTKETIMKTVDNLRELLDVPKPFELIIHDPNGASEFHPMDGVTVEYLD
ncbi:Hypothetical protein SCF082_LOCUS20229 [Durusdinium trenchii]|uniref:ZPR1 jelly-roll domain-containing protein n=1 Tax=Durusdinium trenchii TaxID=1381693 RepID=A0ABP0L119_9DINO